MADLAIEAELCGGVGGIATAGAAVLFTGQSELAGTIVPVRDYIHGGQGTISSTVKKDTDPVDTPMHRKVRLYRDADGMMIRETWSDPVTGVYTFTGISTDYKYTVISYDYEGNFRAVIADGLSLANGTVELMP